MNTHTEELWDALTSGNTRRLVEQMRAVSSTEPQQPRNRISSAPVEGSSPTAGPRTAGAGTSEHDALVISQYRQSIYGYERLIEKLYDLARADRFDELHDLVRAEYLSIHGPRA